MRVMRISNFLKYVGLYKKMYIKICGLYKRVYIYNTRKELGAQNLAMEIGSDVKLTKPLR